MSTKLAPRSSANDEQELYARFAATGLLYAILWWLFREYQPAIVAPHGQVPPLVPWLRFWLSQQDGREFQVCTVATMAFLGALFVSGRSRVQLHHWIPLPMLTALLVSLLVALMFLVRDTDFEILHVVEGRKRWLALPFAIGVGAFVARVGPACDRRRAARIGVMGTLLMMLTAATFGTLVPASTDYAYFIAPALKWLQGEWPTTHYTQYNFLGTVVFAQMMKFRLPLQHMQLVVATLYCIWFGFFAWLAKRLLRSSTLAIACLICAMGLRFLEIDPHPISHPQVSALRMDLWVFIMLAAHRWGFANPRTAVVVALVYVGDSYFGFLYASVYAGLLVWHGWDAFRRGQSVRANLASGACVVVAALVNCWVYGAPLTQAGFHYADIRLGFLPISRASMVWPILLFLALAMTAFSYMWKQRERWTHVFLAFIGGIQLTYFFGRSHEHNLLNISAIWILIPFVLVAHLPTLRRHAAPIAMLAVALCTFATSGVLVRKIEMMLNADRPWPGTAPHHEEASIDRSFRPTLSGEPVLVWGENDAYINYRMGYRQRGFFAPFWANARLEDTARFLVAELRGGRRVILADTRGPADAEDISRTSTYLASERLVFEVVPHESGLSEVKLRSLE